MLLWTLGCMYLFELVFSLFFWIYTQDHMANLILGFWWPSIVAVPIYIPTNSCTRVPFSPHVFICYFSVMLSIFSCACLPSLCLLWKHIYSDILPIFRLGCLLLLNYISCLYILDINPLTVMAFENIVSHFISCLFILSLVSFTMQKFLLIIKSHFFIFVFISIALGDLPKNNATIYVKECSAYVLF